MSEEETQLVELGEFACDFVGQQAAALEADDSLRERFNASITVDEKRALAALSYSVELISQLTALAEEVHQRNDADGESLAEEGALDAAMEVICINQIKMGEIFADVALRIEEPSAVAARIAPAAHTSETAALYRVQQAENLAKLCLS